jgi:DNA-binding transcriptional ArsR family regulator
MIRVELGSDAARKLRFTYSPLNEASLALQAMVNPKRHPTQFRWILATKERLESDLWRTIRALSFAYRDWILGYFSPTPDGTLPSFAEELQRLAQLPLDLFTAETARAFLPDDWPPKVTADQVLGDPAMQDLLLAEARAYHPLYEEPAQLLLTDPERLRQRLLAMLEEFWTARFAATWEEMKPQLIDEIESRGQLFRQHDLFTAFQRTLKGCRINRREGALLFPRPYNQTVDLAQHQTLLLVPSAFTWAYTYIECDPPWAPSLIYPMAYTDPRSSLPPDRLLQVVEALAGETRLQILAHCSQMGRSTQELAQRLGLTEGAISKHLRQLEAAGLVRAKRQSYYVLYRTVTNRIRAVSPALLRYLEQESS